MPRGSQTALPLESRGVGTHSSTDLEVPHWAKGCIIISERTAGTGTFTCNILGKVPGTSNYFAFLAGAAGNTSLRQWIGPGYAPVTNNVISAVPIVDTLRVDLVVAGASATTIVTVVWV